MSAAHTPGPWAVNPFCAQVECTTFDSRGQLLAVAQMLWPTDERSEAETEANARLIAAAPTMLEALENFCLAAEYWAVCDENCPEDSASSEIMRSGGAWPAEAYGAARAAIALAKGGDA